MADDERREGGDWLPPSEKSDTPSGGGPGQLSSGDPLQQGGSEAAWPRPDDDPFGRKGETSDPFGRGGESSGPGWPRADEPESTPVSSGWQPPSTGGGWQQPGGAGPSAGWEQPGGAGGWQQPGGSTSWGQQPGGQYSTGTGNESHGKATTALVLGIIGLVFCQILAIPALIFGYQARNEIDANPGRYSNRGLATAGIVLGWIGIVLMVLGLIAIFAFGVFAEDALDDFDNPSVIVSGIASLLR